MQISIGCGCECGTGAPCELPPAALLTPVLRGGLGKAGALGWCHRPSRIERARRVPLWAAARAAVVGSLIRLRLPTYAEHVAAAYQLQV